MNVGDVSWLRYLVHLSVACFVPRYLRISRVVVLKPPTNRRFWGPTFQRWGYPNCRPPFSRTFEHMATFGRCSVRWPRRTTFDTKERTAAKYDGFPCIAYAASGYTIVITMQQLCCCCVANTGKASNCAANGSLPSYTVRLKLVL